MGKHCGCRGKCHCNKSREIVYPTREDVRKTYSEETVRHIHPSHTRVINYHTIRNVHSYPHTTSYEERVNQVDVRGVRNGGPGGQVAGARSPYGGYRPGVAGARSPYGGGYGDCGGYGGRRGCGRRRGGFW